MNQDTAVSMVAKIISLNVGHPQKMEWQGKQVLSSMLKLPVEGPLSVQVDGINGNSFANSKWHGNRGNILYAYGLTSADDFAKRLGLPRYAPGSTGETLTLDELDETKISVGDLFEIGEVIAQATAPRTPCGKVDVRMQHPEGRQAMIESGRSGVYFRILKPGLIHKTDRVQRVEQSPFPFLISRLYELMTSQQRPTKGELQMAKKNPAFLPEILARIEE